MIHRLTAPVLALALALPLAAPAAAVAATALVLNARNAGPGSFRDAVDRANGNPAITTIQFLPTVRTIRLTATVEFTGRQPLGIQGAGATLDGAGLASGAVLLATGGGDLAVSNLTVRGGPAEGLDVEVPPTATGVQRVWLFNVAVIDNLGHGVLVNDQVDPTAPDEGEPNPAGSAAGLEVTVLASRFLHNGFSVSDRDGVRVNEGGDGHLVFVMRLSAADGNGADGVELDERGRGDVRIDVFGSRFTANGPLDPADLDDGFDIDELNEGSIIGQVGLTSANDNFEEGLDFNENHAGDLRVNLLLVEANGNREEAIDYEEDDDFAGGGDLVTTMVGVRASGSGADGGDGAVKIREKGAGNLQAWLNGVDTRGNDYDGINIREDADGWLQASIVRATSTGNAGEGIVYDERGDGDLSAALANSTALGNGGPDLFANQASTGAGTFMITNVTFASSGGNVTPTVTP
ncbi:MAG: hypothetical protein AB7U83_14255 [Vicinamibacterales bacterium]